MNRLCIPLGRRAEVWPGLVRLERVRRAGPRNEGNISDMGLTTDDRWVRCGGGVLLWRLM